MPTALDSQLEEKAREFRSKLNLTDSERFIPDVALRKLEVLTVFRPFASNFSGLAVKKLFNGVEYKAIYINTSQTLGKQNFTICHELYHLFIQKVFTSRVCFTSRFDIYGDPEEYNADVFAANLLMPRAGIYNVLGIQPSGHRTITRDDLLELELEFGCSRKALLTRLKILGLISRKKYNEWFEAGAFNHARSMGYSLGLYEKTKANYIIGGYFNKAYDLLQGGLISESHFRQLLKEAEIDIPNDQE